MLRGLGQAGLAGRRRPRDRRARAAPPTAAGRSSRSASASAGGSPSSPTRSASTSPGRSASTAGRSAPAATSRPRPTPPGLMTGPVLGIFGGADRGIPPEAVEAFRDALAATGLPHDVVTYPAPRTPSSTARPRTSPMPRPTRGSGCWRSSGRTRRPDARRAAVRGPPARRRRRAYEPSGCSTRAPVLRGATSSTRPGRSRSAAAARKAPSIRVSTGERVGEGDDRASPPRRGTRPAPRRRGPRPRGPGAAGRRPRGTARGGGPRSGGAGRRRCRRRAPATPSATRCRFATASARGTTPGAPPACRGWRGAGRG